MYVCIYIYVCIYVYMYLFLYVYIYSNFLGKYYRSCKNLHLFYLRKILTKYL